MAPNDQPSDPSDEKMSGIISELRQFLSEVKEEKKQPPSPTPEPISERPSTNLFGDHSMFRSAPESIDPPIPIFNDSLGPPIEAPEDSNLNESISTPSDNSGLPSDSDFWNGNVLGWPSVSDEESVQESSVSPFVPEPVVSEPSVDEKFNAPMSSNPQPIDEHVETPPSQSLPPPPEPVSFQVEQKPFSNMNPFAAFTQVAEPTPEPPKADPIQSDGTIVQQNSQFSAEQNNSMPMASAGVVPVDYGKQQKDDHSQNQQSLDEANQIKPAHIIHVACIVPTGQEKRSQQFFSRLREAGHKLKNKLEIEAVFIHEWTADLIDVPAWEKSALLSGADVMFIVALQADFDKFISLLSKTSLEAMPKRLIGLEQIPLQNLYADLLCQLSGKAYVKG